MDGEWVVEGSRREVKGENRKEEELLVCKINIKKKLMIRVKVSMKKINGLLNS